ncbi:MAG: sterol-binding protein [Burkholderiaceae bacterium]|nr:sterol-binding protein [Burkholderiaceae bacterium]
MTTLERPLIAALNHLLSRQSLLRDQLVAHAGKSARIDAGIMQLDISVAADGLLQAGEAEPDVTITIQPADLPNILADMKSAFSYVHISGDAEFARAISELANGLQWEAEEDLAPIVGDIAAVRIVRTARAAAGTVKAGAHKLAENLAEYLLEENPTLLYRRAGDDFAAGVAVLRDDVERLSKRIALLEKAAGGAA